MSFEDSKSWSSGNWRVSAGKADEFIEHWTAFLTWTKQTNDGLLFARLVRDEGDPNHFVSFACWRDGDAVRAWMNMPEFAERLSTVRALCEGFHASGYEKVASV